MSKRNNLILDEVCDWDGSMRQGLASAVDSIKKEAIKTNNYRNSEGNGIKPGINLEASWTDFWTVIIDGVVAGLKECANKKERAWTIIYNSSDNLKNKVENNQQLQQQVGQQAIGLAVGVPGGAAVGAGIYPLFKFCMKFFSK